MSSFGGVGGLAALAGVSLVRAQASPNMTVLVTRERFFMPGSESTHQGMYHGYNDGDVTVTIAASSPTLPRKDIICASVQDQFYSGGTNLWQIDKVTGTPNASPSTPTPPVNSITIAIIDVAANATTVTNANITINAQLATAVGGIVQCTSASRPTSPYKGMEIYETDTDTFLYCQNTTGPIWTSNESGEVFWQQQSVNNGDFGTGAFTTIATIAAAIAIPTWARDGTAILDLDVSINMESITSTFVGRIRIGVGVTAGTPYGIYGAGSAESHLARMRMQYTIPAATTTLSPVIQAIRDSGTGAMRFTTATNCIADWNYSIHR